MILKPGVQCARHTAASELMTSFFCKLRPCCSIIAMDCTEFAPLGSGRALRVAFGCPLACGARKCALAPNVYRPPALRIPSFSNHKNQTPAGSHETPCALLAHVAARRVLPPPALSPKPIR